MTSEDRSPSTSAPDPLPTAQIPESEPTSTRGRAWTLFLILAVAICAIDLWSKAAIWDYLDVAHSGKPPRIDRQATREVPVINGFFNLEANYNYGAFNGMFSSRTDMLAVLSGVALAVIAVIVFLTIRKHPRPSLWFIGALGSVAGGTAGNLYDRAVDAAVRDWIKWYVVIDGRQRVWPNFNIADAGICVGVSILIFLEIRNGLRERRERRAAAA